MTKTKYVLDSQFLIRAVRDGDEAERMEQFLSAALVYLSAVVVQELLAGARDPELRRLRKHFFMPYERKGRLVTPSFRGWVAAGEILRKLRDRGWQITPSLTNDVLIAVSVTEIGATLLHDNARDYNAIQSLYPRLRHRVGWPEREVA